MKELSWDNTSHASLYSIPRCMPHEQRTCLLSRLTRGRDVAPKVLLHIYIRKQGHTWTATANNMQHLPPPTPGLRPTNPGPLSPPSPSPLHHALTTTLVLAHGCGGPRPPYSWPSRARRGAHAPSNFCRRPLASRCARSKYACRQPASALTRRTSATAVV